MLYITTQHEHNIKKRYEQDSAVGHFFLGWLIGPILAQNYGLKYIYSNPVPDYIGNEWNDFLGFKKTFPGYKIENYKIIDLPMLSWPATSEQFRALMKKYEYSSISDEKNIILQTQPGQSLSIDWSYYLNNGLREGYDEKRQENPIQCYFDKDFINVAVHIRRGDINPKDQPERWITDKEYERLLENLCLTLQSKYLENKLKIHIYSEGENGDFIRLIRNPMLFCTLVFHLNEDPMITFHHLVSSDILINAKSAFSVLASYLNKGIKMVIPFSIYWNHSFPKNNNFNNLIEINDNMDFNQEKLND